MEKPIFLKKSAAKKAKPITKAEKIIKEKEQAIKQLKEEREWVNKHICLEETEALLIELGVKNLKWNFEHSTTVYGTVPEWGVESFSLSKFTQRNLWSGQITDLIPEEKKLGQIKKDYIVEEGRHYTVETNLYYDKEKNSFYSKERKEYLSNNYF